MGPSEVCKAVPKSYGCLGHLRKIMAIYRHSVWLSVVQSVLGRRHTNFGTFGTFQDGRASVSGQTTFSRSGWFRIDFQSFQSNFTPELPLTCISFSRFSRVTFQSLSGFSRSGRNFQSYRINVSAAGNKLSAVQDGTIQLSGCFSLVDLSQDETEWR